MYIQAFRGVGRGEWEERKGDCTTFVVPCAVHMEIGALRKLRWHAKINLEILFFVDLVDAVDFVEFVEFVDRV